MEYKEWSVIYTYGLFLGSAVGAVVIILLWLLGFDKSIPYLGKLLIYLIVVIPFVIGAWYYKVKKKQKP